MAPNQEPTLIPNPEPTRRGFWCLVGVQAQGAFNDNAFKVMLMLTAALIAGENAKMQATMNGLIALMIPLSFMIFSCWAGMLADKFSKWAVTMTVKVIELVIMFLAFMVYWTSARHGAPTMSTLYAGIFVGMLLFTHSAFFSPSKYGIIPELVSTGRVTWANGIVGMTTNLSIILGTIFANELFAWFKPTPEHPVNRLYLVPLTLMGLSIAGFLLGWGVTRTTPANPTRRIDLNYFPELKRYFKILLADRVLTLTVAGLAYFWGVGVLLVTHANVWGEHSLGLSQAAAGRLFWFLGLGIGVGSFLAGWLSRDRIETGLIPLGGLGIALCCLPLAFASPANRYFMIGMIFLVGVSAGMYSVPLFAILQSRTERADRGGLLGAAAYVTDGMMLIVAVLYIVLNQLLNPSPNSIFLIISVATLAGMAVLLRLLPEELIRLVGFIIIKGLYRIRVFGVENIPQTGPALLVSNHVSFIDALLVQAAVGRKIRFIVLDSMFRKPILRYFLRTTQCIPVSSDQSPRELIRSFKDAAATLKEGELLCIFAEGQITRTGQLLAFHRGYSIILKEAPAPVVPLYLDGVWGSIFSFERNRFFWKWPRQIPYRVRLMAGRPLPPEVSPFDLHQAIEELGAEAAIAKKDETVMLHENLVRQCRRNWGRFLMVDILSPPITMGQALWRSIMLARRLRPLWEGQQTVGVLLPPSVAGALVNYAAALGGRTVVNLNYTTGQAILDTCAHKAGIRTVVTARPFLEKLNLKPPGEPIYIEDYRGFRGFGEVFTALIAGRLFPLWWIERLCGMKERATPRSLATIIFSSGSTGEPKGVMLSQANVSGNVESFHTGIRILPEDRMLGILPLFHSFGYTVTLWGSIYFPFGVVYHMSPLDVKTIGELCEKHHVTILVTTPTFLQQYLRRINPAQFGGVNCVITGAEKLPETLQLGFRERFKVDPLQGYGTTECAPVVSVNVDDYRQPGVHQVGHKPGSIGHPIPNVAVKIIHPETGEPVPQGQSGLLMVKGLNVMEGYLGMPEKTAEVLREGWYNTGDVAYLDEDGFIFITDRLSRFSKIGGEMVPHVKIEEKLNQALETQEQKLVVTSTPDSRKGEQLVVLHVLGEAELERLLGRLGEIGLPNLWSPRRENFIRVEAIPLLGTGKLDLQAIKRIASERVG